MSVNGTNQMIRESDTPYNIYTRAKWLYPYDWNAYRTYK